MHQPVGETARPGLATHLSTHQPLGTPSVPTTLRKAWFINNLKSFENQSIYLDNIKLLLYCL